MRRFGTDNAPRRVMARLACPRVARAPRRQSRARHVARDTRAFMRLPQLALPGPTDETPEALSHVPAGTLFLARARQSVPAFSLMRMNAPIIAAICRRLCGLPLAIELAAAKVVE